MYSYSLNTEQQGIRLRDIKESDLELILAWRNSDRIRSVMFNDALISYEQHLHWYQKLSGDPNRDCKLFEIGSKPIGVVNYTAIDKQNGTCTWGFYVGENNAPPKSGTILGFLALNYAFNNLAVRKLCSEILLTNARSINFHQKFGFKEEGLFKEHVWQGGKYQDVVAMALFREDWEQMKITVEHEILEVITSYGQEH